MRLPFISRSKHLRLVAEAEKAAIAQTLLDADRMMAQDAKGTGRTLEYVDRTMTYLTKELEESRAEIRRLTDIIVELKREGRETRHPVEGQWGSYTTAEADAERQAQLEDPEYAARMAEIEVREHHEQMLTTDGGPHTGYIDALELEAAAKRALESELPDM